MKRGCNCAANGTYTTGDINDLLHADVSKGGSDDIRWETEDCTKPTHISISRLEEQRDLDTHIVGQLDWHLGPRR